MQLGLTTIAVGWLWAAALQGVNGGKQLVKGDMPWITSHSVIAVRWTKNKVKVHEIDMGVGDAPVPGDRVRILTKLFTTKRESYLKRETPGEVFQAEYVGFHIYSNATVAEATDINVGGENKHVVAGLVDAVEDMRLGARRKALLPPLLAWGARGKPDWGIEFSKYMLYFIEVIGIEKNVFEPIQAPKAQTHTASGQRFGL